MRVLNCNSACVKVHATQKSRGNKGKMLRTKGGGVLLLNNFNATLQRGGNKPKCFSKLACRPALDQNSVFCVGM